MCNAYFSLMPCRVETSTGVAAGFRTQVAARMIIYKILQPA